MPGLLYYLPERDRAIKLEELRTAGLGYAFERAPTCCGVQGGPDGSPGVVVADPQSVPESQIGHYPDRQTWRKMPASPNWVAYYTADRPASADLQRDQVLPGHWIRLADGQEWLAPIARGAGEEDDRLVWYQNLPEATSIDGEGNWTRTGVLPRYERLWEIATRWWDARSGATISDDAQQQNIRATFDFDGLNDAALAALAANYRVGKAEVALLGLFDDHCTAQILDALIDWPTIETWLKKKLPSMLATSSTDAGPPAAHAVTDPR